MNTIRVAQEPHNAFEVACEFKHQCQEMLKNLRSLTIPFVREQIMSTPVCDYVFFEHKDQLACVPRECVYNGSVESSAKSDPYLAEELDLSVEEMKSMAESMAEWNGRPVFTTTQSSF